MRFKKNCAQGQFIYFPIRTNANGIRTISTIEQTENKIKEKFEWIWPEMLNFIVTAEADVEFSSKLSARGMSDTEISGLEKPSTMLTSLEEYVRNVFTR